MDNLQFISYITPLDLWTFGPLDLEIVYQLVKILEKTWFFIFICCFINMNFFYLTYICNIT